MITVFLEEDLMSVFVSISISEMMEEGWGSPCLGQFINCKRVTMSVLDCWEESSIAVTSILLSTMSP
jgi:hypothetical protein